VGERLKPAVLKTVRLERASGVRIPPPPPVLRFQWVRFLPKAFPKNSSELLRTHNSVLKRRGLLMAGKYSIYKYVKLAGKGWQYACAVYHPNGKIKPDAVLVKDVNGKNVEEKHPEG
jgi:hypothetical protein